MCPMMSCLFARVQCQNKFLKFLSIRCLCSVDAHSKDAEGTIQEIHEACRDIGFLYLTGHGMKERVMKGMMDKAWEFFALPKEKKMALHMPENSAIQPWLGYMTPCEFTSPWLAPKKGPWIISEIFTDSFEHDCTLLHYCNSQ